MASYLFPLSSSIANSRVTSKYNIRRAQFNNKIHGGIDLVADSGWVSKNGQPDLLATIGGTIYLVRFEANGFGNYCVIRGTDGYYHIYGHMKSPAPWQVGQTIGQGQKVGDIGSTGHSTGIHLHYEVRQNFADKATRLDPCQLLALPMKRVWYRQPETMWFYSVAAVQIAAPILQQVSPMITPMRN